MTTFNLPATDKILRGSDSHLWFLTELGLYLIEDAAHPSAPKPVPELTGSIAAATIGVDGSIWAVRRRQLIHLHTDGSAHAIEMKWPQPAFEPMTLAISKTGVIWAGGAGGGLYRLSLDGDRLLAITQFGAPDLISQHYRFHFGGQPGMGVGWNR